MYVYMYTYMYIHCEVLVLRDHWLLFACIALPLYITMCKRQYIRSVFVVGFYGRVVLFWHGTRSLFCS